MKITKERYEKNKKFIKQFEKENLTDTLSLILMLISIPLIGLGLDLKLKAFTNGLLFILIGEFMWLACSTTELLIKAFQNKKYEEKQNAKKTEENTTSEQN